MDGQRSKRRYRRHGEEFKRRVLAQSAAPGARIAEVAAAHGVHPSLIYAWRSRNAESVWDGATAAPGAAVARFVPVTVADAAPAAIRIELRRGDSVAQVHWPLSAAEACGQWLGQWLR